MYRLKKFISAKDQFTLLINNLPTRVVPIKTKVVFVDYEPHNTNLEAFTHDGGYGLCPLCGKWGDNIPSDYTSQSMIWCNCSYLVLDVKNMVSIDIDTVYNDLLAANITNFDHDKENLVAFEVPLVYILKAADVQIMHLEFIDGKYSEQKVRDFMTSDVDHYRDPTLYKLELEKYGLQKAALINYKYGRRKDNGKYEQFYEFEPEYKTFNVNDYNDIHIHNEPYSNIHELDLKVYLPINSYNVDTPFFPFTENICWMHDVFVRMDCKKVLPDGRLDNVRFVVTQSAD